MTAADQRLILRPEAHGEEGDVRRVVERAFGKRVIGELVARLRASPDSRVFWDLDCVGLRDLPGDRDI